MKTRSATLLTDIPLFKALPVDELARLQEISANPRSARQDMDH
jgi:hypothetical protein